MKCCGLLLSLALCAGCATTCVRETPRAVRLGTARVETTALVEALRTQVKGTRISASDIFLYCSHIYAVLSIICSNIV